ncbi:MULTISPECIES: bifunctional nuclease family protein [Arthrobacter]|uniref:Bifunctional nuclease family protein n=2 Tax=Arthrobacter TaxID=1663 RepID=A0ABU9KI40_9MICC|nr:bifunctional nuclease family protein [Arthrobacter sp. YJM1]MDP5226230.1 bifunctional nuclease family protein [Arthrobacter sp. YJM1]
MIEVEVVGVRIELPGNQPLVLLKEVHGERHVPIWIGPPEASAIALAQQGVVPPRPLTHDLLLDVVHSLGRELVSVTIVSVEDSVFYAQLQFDDGTSVSSRASDALALALRGHCRIWCAEQVLEEAGVLIDVQDEDAEVARPVGDDAAEQPGEGGAGDASAATAEQESELRRFREFLDDIEPEDFEP